MTALVFVAAFALAYLNFATRGWYVWDGVTIYVAAFVATLATASLWALLSRSGRCIAATAVLVLNFGITHWGWVQGDPVIIQAASDLATAAYFIIAGSTRWEWAIGGVMLLSVGSAALTQLGVIPGPGERPPIFLAWSYADITSIAGHAASIILGIGAGDWGRRVRTRAIRRPGFLGSSGSLAMKVLHQRST